MLRNIQRRIAREISFTVTCTGMPYINIYIYIYIYIQVPKTDMRKSQFYLGKTYDIPLHYHTAMTTTVYISQIFSTTR